MALVLVVGVVETGARGALDQRERLRAQRRQLRRPEHAAHHQDALLAKGAGRRGGQRALAGGVHLGEGSGRHAL
jgi:hypothetical protein